MTRTARLGATALVSLTAACSAVLGIEPASWDPGEEAKEDAGPTGDVGDASTATAPTNPASCSRDLATDPDNCGTCGRSCAGGACASGQCQPVSTFVVGVESLTARGDALYWATRQTVSRCVGADRECQPTLLLSTRASTAARRLDALVVTDTELHVRDDRTVTVLPLDRPWQSSPISIPEDWAVSGEAVVNGTAFLVIYPTRTFGRARLLRCPANDCTKGPSTDLPSAFGRVVAAGDKVLTITSRPGHPDLVDVSSCDDATCAPPFITLGGDVTGYLASDGRTLAWMANEGGTRTLKACDLPGCAAPRTVSAHRSLHGLSRLIVDGSSIYFTEWDASTIRRCDVSSCPEPAVVASDQPSAESLVATARFLYWHVPGRHDVARLVKPEGAR